ncbi:uncharacterized protein LOC119386423 [Rhipicephalus sanguineus]|uniref:uncharacterized protein LOC119386423 n=1 Tax=Rhipicephalus sanguineus TaxID=34632 RepID=UPI0020C1FAC8|nr:uncharacterized protein LOC119386423 [Rhipicephalus sanguineus]
MVFTWESVKNPHSYYSGQVVAPQVSTTMSSVDEGVMAEKTTPAAAGHLSNRDTQAAVAAISTVGASTVFRKAKIAEVNEPNHSSLTTDTSITSPQEPTSTKEQKDYTLPPIYNINKQYTESYSAMSSEDGTDFVAPYFATRDKRPHTGRDVMKTTLPLFIEDISKTSLHPTAPSSRVDMVVFTLPSPALVTKPPKHTSINFDGTSHLPRELQATDGSVQRKGETHVDTTAVLINPSIAVTDFSETSEGHHDANKVNAVYPWTGEKAVMPTVAPTPKPGSLRSSVAETYTPRHYDSKAVIRKENDARPTATISTKGPVNGSQDDVVLYPRSTLPDSTLKTPMSTTLLTFSPSPSNDELNTVVTFPTTNAHTNNIEMITGVDKNTQKKSYPSQTEAIYEFKNEVNTTINTESNDFGNVLPPYHLTEAYSLDNIGREANNSFTSQSTASVSVDTKPLNNLFRNTPGQWSRPTTTIGNRIQLDVTPTYNVIQSFLDSPTTEGTHPFTSELSDFNFLGSKWGTRTEQHMARRNPTYFAEMSAQKPFTTVTTARNTDSGSAYSTILQSLQEDIHSASNSLTELHLSKSSGRNRILNPSISVHFSTRYLAETTSATETTRKHATATPKEGITDPSTEPQFFTPGTFTTGIEGATASEKYLLLNEARHTEVKEDTRPQVTEPYMTYQLTSPNSEEREDTDRMKLTEPATSASVSSPLPEPTTRKGECTFSTESKNKCKTISRKAKLQVTTKTREYAEKAILRTTTTSETSVAPASATKRANSWTTLLMTSSGLPKSTRAPVCKSKFGLFRHPTDCNRFVHCSNSVPFIKKCPANLHFNERIMVCDWPYRAGCLMDVKK